MTMPALIRCLLVMALCAPASAWAQIAKGTLELKPLPPLANPKDPKLPAKELFGRKAAAAPLAARAIGFYAKGCLAGALALPVNGKTWQVMRLSRNRNWGHPTLVKLIERVADLGAKAGWPGLLVGDISQPRGGPMLTGHTSHQVGLDADLWLTPMPKRELTRQEREEMSAIQTVRDDRLDVNPTVWTSQHTSIIKIAAEQPEVARIFVNAAIKKALCRDAGKDRRWLSKVRPYY
ncbi:MAG: penicillin-insensitive murein endopeptidase, partial [Xanthobacteraceae bacterium]